MANVKITDLTTHTNPASTDVLPIVDVGADITKKVSIADLLENAGSGTESAPGIAFDGDSNTGIYRPGADQVAISTNGAQRLLIDSDGDINIDSGGVFYDATNNRLAIGTTNPEASLHVTGSNSGGDFVGQIIQNIANPTAPDTSAELRLRLSHDQPDKKYAGIKAIGTASYNNKIDLAFFTLNGNNSIFISNQERVRITGDGYLRLSSNSGGIQFNGDTAAANALDDYEEGTWGNPADMYDRRYVKIGRLVHLTIEAIIPGSGPAFLQTLPFAVSISTAGYDGYAVGSWFIRRNSDPYTSYAPVEAASLQAIGSTISLYKSGAAFSRITKAELQTAIGGSDDISALFASISYYAAT